MDIGVVGGGIGGLTAARALVKAGHEVRVYERAPALNEVGAGITLWSNALRVLEALGVADALRAQGTQATGGVIALADGTRLVDLSAADLPDGVDAPDMIALHRADLQSVLLEGIEARVSFNKALEALEQRDLRVALRFADGSEVDHDLVVGADGIRSVVRRFVASEQPIRYSGYTCWRGVCPIPEGWRGPVGEYWGVGKRLGVVEIGQGRLYWFAVADAPEGTPAPGSNDKAMLLERFGDFAFDGPMVLEATAQEDILHHDICDRPPARGWVRGRVVLLGDAAHPTTPNMGQGAAMAIEDSAVLARVLDDDVVESALSRYEATRFGRAQFVTSTSWTVGRMAHAKNPLMRAVRNRLFAWMPMSMRLKQLEKVAGYDALSAPLA